jgi:tetratricopeptide (TPR) repeat protein
MVKELTKPQVPPVGREIKAEAMFVYGKALYRQQSRDEAVQALKEALRLGLESALAKEAHCCIGIILAKTERTQEALRHFKRALAITQHCGVSLTQTYHAIGAIYYKANMWDEAVFFFNKAIEAAPRQPCPLEQLVGLHILCGKCQLELANYPAAVRSFKAGLKAMQDAGSALPHLENECEVMTAQSYQHDGMHKLAIAHYMQALEASRIRRSWILGKIAEVY